MLKPFQCEVAAAAAAENFKFAYSGGLKTARTQCEENEEEKVRPL